MAQRGEEALFPQRLCRKDQANDAEKRFGGDVGGHAVRGGQEPSDDVAIQDGTQGHQYEDGARPTDRGVRDDREEQEGEHAESEH